MWIIIGILYIICGIGYAILGVHADKRVYPDAHITIYELIVIVLLWPLFIIM